MIKISNLSKIFENKKRKIKALNNLNISFHSKGLCFIVGASGAPVTIEVEPSSLNQ